VPQKVRGRKESFMYSEQITTQNPPLMEFWMAADLGAVPLARHRATHICMEIGFSDDVCLDLDIALGEALANAVVHGGSAELEENKQICLSVWRFQGRLIIQVRDSGAGFSPPPPPYPMPDALYCDTHGRGLPLMQTLTDALVVCRGCALEGGASVFLIKAMPPGRN